MALRELTSLAPASRSNLIIGPIVFPLTMESSTSTIFFPFTFSDKAPNFLATPSCLSRVLGWMNVLPTYLFLHSTSAKGILDCNIKKRKVLIRREPLVVILAQQLSRGFYLHLLVWRIRVPLQFQIPARNWLYPLQPEIPSLAPVRIAYERNIPFDL